MTCIVGIESAGKVFMGCDSAATEGWNIRIATAPKVFVRHEMVIGYTYSFRMGQILQYAPDYPCASNHDNNYSYLVCSFIPFIRDLFVRSGFIKIENSREEGGQFLIGIRGELYCIHSDFSALRSTDGFDAIGCGAPYALGALAAMELSNQIDALRIALEIAERFSNGVRGPFKFEAINP